MAYIVLLHITLPLPNLPLTAEPRARLDTPLMYLETIIDKEPDLQIIYHYEEDVGATLLETTWAELDKFCNANHIYEIKLEHYDAQRADISQTYLPTDIKSWIDHLDNSYKVQMLDQFIQYCQHCRPSQAIAFYH